MQFVPQNNYVIVKKTLASTTTTSGIILQTSQGADSAKVLAFADDVKGLDVGDNLMIRWSNALKIDGDIYAVDSKEIVTKILE